MKKLLAGLAAALVALAAQAGGFDNTTVTYQYYYSDLSSPYSNAANGNYFVGPGGAVVSNIVDNRWSMTIQGDTLDVVFTSSSSFSPGSYNGFVLTDNDLTFTSFSMISNSALSGAPILSFDAHNLYVNFVNLGFNPGEVVFSINAVPEPETYAMMIAGLGVLGAIARRRKQAAA